MHQRKATSNCIVQTRGGDPKKIAEMRIETVKTLFEIIISNHFSVLFEYSELGYEIMHNWRVPECTVLSRRGFIVVCKLERTVRFTDDVTGAQQ